MGGSYWGAFDSIRTRAASLFWFVPSWLRKSWPSPSEPTRSFASPSADWTCWALLIACPVPRGQDFAERLDAGQHRAQGQSAALGAGQEVAAGGLRDRILGRDRDDGDTADPRIAALLLKHHVAVHPRHP